MDSTREGIKEKGELTVRQGPLRIYWLDGVSVLLALLLSPPSLRHSNSPTMDVAETTQQDSLFSAKSMYEELRSLHASPVETSIGGNTPGYSPARSLHISADMLADACISFAETHTLDGVDCGAVAKRQLSDQLDEFRKDTKYYLQRHGQETAEEAGGGHSEQEATKRHLNARITLLSDLKDQSVIAGDYNGYQTLKQAAALGQFLTESWFPSGEMFDQGFAPDTVIALHSDLASVVIESGLLVGANKKYTELNTAESGGDDTAPTSRKDLPAFQALFDLGDRTATQVDNMISFLDQSQEAENDEPRQDLRDSLVSIYNAILDLNEPMAPHMEEMYGIVPIDVRGVEKSRDS